MLRSCVAIGTVALGTALMAAVTWAAAPAAAPVAASVSPAGVSSSAGGTPTNALRSVLQRFQPAPAATGADTTVAFTSDAVGAGTVSARTGFEPGPRNASVRSPAAGVSGAAVSGEDRSDTNWAVVVTGIVLVLLVASRRGRRF